MIIDCISDLHGHYPKLEGGDLLIVAGDLTARDDHEGYFSFRKWFQEQKYKKKILIAGNHDNALVKGHFLYPEDEFDYLFDSGTEFEGLKIWGSPWTKTFEGMNPKCKAFTCDTEEELAEKWALIPDNIDILITHFPAFMCFDETIDKICVGSVSLASKIRRIEPKIHICGHIHECGGKISDGRKIESNYVCKTICINASHVNERYEPVNKPVRVIL